MLKTYVERNNKPFYVGRGRGFELVLWTAWREGREMIRGYGMTEDEAMHDLRYSVQPDWDGTMDGSMGTHQMEREKN